MSKKLKLAALSPRILRSGKTLVVADPTENTSPYFAGEKKPTTRKTVAKKRSPIEIEHEASEGKTDVKSVGETSAVRIIKSENATNGENVKAEEKSEVKSANGEKSTDRAKEAGAERNEIVRESRPRPADSESVEDEKRWMPPRWETVLANIREMRKHKAAPVDEMGCHKCADPNASAPVSRYQSLVALMLSSQTKDQVTYAAMQRLNAYGCKPDAIAATPDEVLGKLIYPVGFWKV